MSRYAKARVIVGKNKTGKSALVRSLVEESGKRALIVDFNGHTDIWKDCPWLKVNRKEDCISFEGIVRVPYTGYENDTFEYIYKNLKNSFLVLDDMAMYVDSNYTRSQPYLKKIMVDYAHLGLDIFCIVHSVNDLPPNMWGHMKQAIIGSSQHIISGDRRKMISEAEEFEKIQRSMNAKYKKQYKEGGTAHYGLFQKIDL